MQRGYFNMERTGLPLTYTGLPPATTSLTPNPSPNGEGSENHCLQIKESLTPNPSPNGEGSDDYCLQIKGAFRWCEERLSS